jgi:hypothetical protein
MKNNLRKYFDAQKTPDQSVASAEAADFFVIDEMGSSSLLQSW